MMTTEELMQVHKEVTDSGFQEWRPDHYFNGTSKGWYKWDDLFMFGDYVGSVISQSNIKAVEQMIINTDSLSVVAIKASAPSSRIEDDLNNPKILVLSLTHPYWTEQLIFNMPRIKEQAPDLYEELLGLGSYSILNEDIQSQVEIKRYTDQWYECVCEDVLMDIYNIIESPEEGFRPWYKKVLAKHSKEDLLQVWLYPDEDGYCYGTDCIYYETGRNIYFKTKESDGKLTPPMEAVKKVVLEG